MTAQTRSEIAELLERHDLSPVHRLGQHFLADANITRKIVSLAAVGPGDQVLEIGAGTGTLSLALAEAGSSVVAYEIDKRLQPLLAEVVEGLPIEVRFEDITKVDLSEALGPGSWKMVANLPYKVGTPLILDAMRNHSRIVNFVVMVQREVADRFCANPGGKDYGLPSVVTQIHTNPVLAFRVPPQVFIPAPNVESAVVVMPRREAAAGAERAIGLAAAAFGQRRKMLRKSLAGVLEQPARCLEAAGIPETARAEELSPEMYIKLAQVQQ